MKKSLLSAFSIFSLTFLLIFSGCEIGMGAMVDLEPPVISLKEMHSGENFINKNFETSIYCNKNVTFVGTAEDNLKVTNVRVEIKWADEDEYQFLKNANLKDNDWSIKVEFKKEGACSLKFVAEDQSGNYGAKSSKIITLFVDNNAPVGDSWYIDRLNNGIQYSLQSLAALKNIVLKDPELTQPSNIDVAQNVELEICSAFSDSSGIKDVSISIFDEEGNKVLAGIKNSAGSNYAPRFRITHDALVGAQPNLATGVHYLQVRYSAEDTVTDPSSNNVKDKEINLGWFIWWPESDNPKYSISDLKKDDLGHSYISLPISSSLTITVFDDDGLADIMSCEFFDNNSQSKGRSEATAKANEREHVLSLKAPDIPQELHLLINTKAVSGEPLEDISIPVKVTDESIPNLIISEPENNKIPTVTGSLSDPEINFAGQTLDKANCKYLEFVWVPDSVTTTNKNAKAIQWLDYRVQNSLNTEPLQNISSPVYGEGDYAGMKLWSVKLTDTTQNPNDVLKEKSFSFALKLKSDFESNGINEKTHDKYFLIRLIREDGNYSDSELKLAADDLEPVIDPIFPAGNMTIIDKDDDLTIKFKVSKDSGLPLEKCELYYVPVVPKDGDPNDYPPVLQTITPNNQTVYDSGTVFTAETIDKTVLASYLNRNENPKFMYYAKDILGNENTETFQYIISEKPQIKTITSSAPAKNKKGDKILINVTFSKSVTVSNADKPKIKLIGISRENYNGDFYAELEPDGGSGSTTLVFSYTVQEGDTATYLDVDNPVSGPLILTHPESLGAHLDTLTTANNLKSKRSENPITIDGVSPFVNAIKLETAVDSGNVDNNTKYLRAGRTVTAVVSVSEKVTVQGSPKFIIKVGSGNDTIELPWQSVALENGVYKLRFSKKVETTDPSGSVTYDKATCIVGIDYIKDDYNNSCLNNKLTGTGNSDLYIDTTIPKTPQILNSSGNEALEGGTFNNSIFFTLNNPSTDTTDKAFDTLQYSKNGGQDWTTYTTGSIEVAESASLVARTKDIAGNVSAYAGPVVIEINKTFPDFTVECKNPDGNYKAGSKIELKVNFARAVNIPANSAAYITLNNGQNALLKSTAAQENVLAAEFEYTTRNTDDFRLSVATNAIHLTGFTDEYGNSQGSKPLAQEYSRPDVHCDSVAPKVINMVPDGSKDNNVYDNGQTITLTFDEPVQLGNGMLYLRQVKDWAIPPVLTASEFTTICNSFPSDYAETGINILSVQENGIDMEDSAWNNDSDAGHQNTGYHGTGQYIGPYKKSSQGIDSNGNPDVSTKYVLDFNMDIWETNTVHYYNKTFVPNNNDKGNESYTEPSSNPRTANNIREALEKVHYHERYMSAVAAVINGNTVTLNFPMGLLGDTDLPYGRKWELVIEKGSFMDDTGNKFGAETDGTIAQKDSVQTATGTSGSQSDSLGTWGRGRTTVPANEKPLVLIKNGSNEYFWSDKVAVPVIRVDRYSYGSGIFQSNVAGTTLTQIGTTGNTIPSCYVRVRIDCETEGAVIYYKSQGETNTQAENKATPDYSNEGRGTANTYYTSTTSVLNQINLGTSGGTTVEPNDQTGKTPQIKFALGSGNYKQSYKGYVKAKATKTNHTANTEIASEGIFQTVVCFINPTRNGGGTIAGHTEVFSIRGTTNIGGEPTISPFPLRDNQLLTPFIRHTYRERYDINNSNDFYWVSYEVLVDSCFSGHVSYGGGSWISQWGKMKPGEFTRCTGMVTW